MSHRQSPSGGYVVVLLSILTIVWFVRADPKTQQRVLAEARAETDQVRRKAAEIVDASSRKHSPSAASTPTAVSPAVPTTSEATAKAQPAATPTTPVTPTTAAPSTTPTAQCDANKQLDAFVSQVSSAIDFNEGPGGYTKFNWHDVNPYSGHDFGVSVGKLQWNQEAGQLPDLLRQFDKKDTQQFHQIFGAYAERMLDENYVRHVAVIAKGSELGTMMQQALATPAFQEVQDELMHQVVAGFVTLGLRYGHDSQLFLAEVADIANQTGASTTEAYLNESGARQNQNESDTIAKLTHAASYREGAKRRDSYLATQFADSVDARVC